MRKESLVKCNVSVPRQLGICAILELRNANMEFQVWCANLRFPQMYLDSGPQSCTCVCARSTCCHGWLFLLEWVKRTRAMNDQKEEFERFCRHKFIDVESKGQGSKTITKEKGQKTIKVLKKEGEQYCPKFRHWMKQRKFQLVSYSALGLHDVLCLPAKSEVM